MAGASHIQRVQLAYRDHTPKIADLFQLIEVDLVVANAYCDIHCLFNSLRIRRMNGLGLDEPGLLFRYFRKRDHAKAKPIDPGARVLERHAAP